MKKENPIKISKEHERALHRKEKNTVASKHVERSLTLLVTKEKQMRATGPDSCTLTRLADIYAFGNFKCQRRCG